MGKNRCINNCGRHNTNNNNFQQYQIYARFGQQQAYPGSSQQAYVDFGQQQIYLGSQQQPYTGYA